MAGKYDCFPGARPANPGESSGRGRSRWLAGIIFTGLIASCGTREVTPNRRVRVGVDTFPPYSFVDAGGHETGLAVDLIDEAARRRHISIVWVPVAGGDSDKALSDGVVDLWPVVGITADRLNRFHITQPWFQNAFCLVSRHDSPFSRGRTADTGLVAHANRPLATQMARRFLPGAHLLPVPSNTEALEDLCKGVVTGSFVEARTFEAFLLGRSAGCGNIGLDVHYVKNAVTYAGIGAQKAFSGVADELHGEIMNMVSDGTFLSSVNQWASFSSDEMRLLFAFEKANERKRLLFWDFVIACFGAVVVGTLLKVAARARSMTRIIERTVKERTAELEKEIADRRLLEGQLVQAQKLESIGHLAAGIAHEINTPIQYVGDNTRFLGGAFASLQGLVAQFVRFTEAAGERPEFRERAAELKAAAENADLDYLLDEIPRAVEQALEGVGRVANIVVAMKEFSHPDSGEKELIDINHAIENTLAVCRNEWKYVADVETDLDATLPLVQCLGGEINQVVLNLVVNAAHAIGSGSGGSAVRGLIRISTRRHGDWVEIRVKDNGTGIPEAVRPRIFTPFFTTKEVGKGTGQGLCLARTVVVKKHGGTLTFETAEGAGTTFIARLPVQSVCNTEVAA